MDVWGVHGAKRKNRRERAAGGMVMGIRKELMEREMRIKMGREGILAGEASVGEEKWRIIGVYVGEGEMERILRDLDEWIGG